MSFNPEALPSLKKDLQNSLLFLQQRGASGDSLFDHISKVIAKVVDERPQNVVDHFELFSERVRLETFEMNENLLAEAYKEPSRLAIALKLLPKLIERSQQSMIVTDNEEAEEAVDEAVEEDEDEIISEVPPKASLWELQFHWNMLGIGLKSEEIFALACSMDRLKENPDLGSCRFWGKILGLKSDYFIVESTLTANTLANTIENRIDAIETPVKIMSLELMEERLTIPVQSEAETIGKETSDLRPESKEYPNGWNFDMKVAASQHKPPIELPAEEIGQGVNRQVYFVSTNLNNDWIELPPVSPHQINVARRIKKFLSGDLDEPVDSFPGSECNYLRALIARISAGSHVSPKNFFRVGSDDVDDDEHFDDDEDDDGVINNDKPITANESFKPWPLSKLTQLSFWVHHKPEILKQGRATYIDGRKLAQNSDDIEASSDDESEEEDEEAAGDEKITPEIPSPLFASCFNDSPINGGTAAWTIRLSDTVETLVYIQSHVWPGAYAFAKERICDNIYIGHGHKYSSTNFAPLMLPRIPAEYGDEIVDGDDPTVEEENAIAMQLKGSNDDLELIDDEGDDESPDESDENQ